MAVEPKDLARVRIPAAFDGARLQYLDIDSDGCVKARIANSLVTESYDEIALTYDGTKLSTVVYKLASATVATLTLSYSGTTLTGVTKT